MKAKTSHTPRRCLCSRPRSLSRTWSLSHSRRIPDHSVSNGTPSDVRNESWETEQITLTLICLAAMEDAKSIKYSTVDGRKPTIFAVEFSDLETLTKSRWFEVGELLPYACAPEYASCHIMSRSRDIRDLGSCHNKRKIHARDDALISRRSRNANIIIHSRQDGSANNRQIPGSRGEDCSRPSLLSYT